MNWNGRSRIALGAFIAAGVLCASASAQTISIYKLIDKNGKVTYSESAPKNFDGKVIRLDFDPNANTATLAKPEAPRAESGKAKVRTAKEEALARLNAAQERLGAAKKALQNARDNPAEDDILMVGKIGGGVRHIPSESYQQKLDKLEQEVKDAEDELRRAERGV